MKDKVLYVHLYQETSGVDSSMFTVKFKDLNQQGSVRRNGTVIVNGMRTQNPIVPGESNKLGAGGLLVFVSCLT